MESESWSQRDPEICPRCAEKNFITEMFLSIKENKWVCLVCSYEKERKGEKKDGKPRKKEEKDGKSRKKSY